MITVVAGVVLMLTSGSAMTQAQQAPGIEAADWTATSGPSDSGPDPRIRL
jgi:hypothetical protein